jgi:hypothetical protein
LIKAEQASNLKDLPATDSQGILTAMEVCCSRSERVPATSIAFMQQWEQAMKGEDAMLKATPPTNHDPLVNGDGSDLPPIRKAGGIAVSVKCVPLGSSCFRKCLQKPAVPENSAGDGSTGSGSSGKRIASHDYRAWDKFSVDAECAKIDKEEEEERRGVEVGKEGPFSNEGTSRLSERGKGLC